MVNKEVARFIRAYANCKLVNSFSHKSQKLLQTIDSDTLFDVVFIEFWEPGEIPDQDGPSKILTLLDCMTLFGITAATEMKKNTVDQAAQ